MRVLIVEDETAAYENIVDILQEIDPSIKVVGNAESVSQTVQWLSNNPLPDLILMDIHLSDGLSFSIFDVIEVETPIIFTTAYDEYAIQAFKVNSIDYLLKPIKVEELRNALLKFSKWNKVEVVEYLDRLIQLAPGQRQKDKLLIPVRDKLLPVPLSDVSFIYTTDKLTTVYLKNGEFYPYNKSLEQIFKTLNQQQFYRANKQFIIARDSVKDITIWFDSRLRITLDVVVPEHIYISKNKASEFKQWIVNE